MTADELAQLVGIYHWKINGLPASDKPYWGIRVVALRPDNTVMAESNSEQFGTSVTANGNDQVLVGLKSEPDGISGTLMLGSRPNAVARTRFKFAHSLEKAGSEQDSIGLSWHDDRADLIYFVDENRQKSFSVSLELLHDRPK